MSRGLPEYDVCVNERGEVTGLVAWSPSGEVALAAAQVPVRADGRVELRLAWELPVGLLLPDASHLPARTRVVMRHPLGAGVQEVRVEGGGTVDGHALSGMRSGTAYTFESAGPGRNEWLAFPLTESFE